MAREVRSVLLNVISDNAPKKSGHGNLQSRTILFEVSKQFGSRNPDLDEAILTHSMTYFELAILHGDWI